MSVITQTNMSLTDKLSGYSIQRLKLRIQIFTIQIMSEAEVGMPKDFYQAGLCLGICFFRHAKLQAFLCLGVFRHADSRRFYAQAFLGTVISRRFYAQAFLGTLFSRRFYAQAFLCSGFFRLRRFYAYAFLCSVPRLLSSSLYQFTYRLSSVAKL